MLTAIAAVACLAPQAQASPYELPIGRSGTWMVAPGRMLNTVNGRPATADDVAKAAEGKRFVFLGEQHATTPHQQMQASIIDALARQGRKVIVGMEMYQRPVQPVLDEWAKGSMSEEDLLAKSDWKGQWGYDFAYYRPIFDVARSHKIPILGLNVPRDWVRTVGRGGFAGLSADQKSQLPAEMELTNKDHRNVFTALIGGHPDTPEAAFNNMYAAQVLWDEGMADTIARHMAANKPSRETVYVVIAGSGHMMYGQGINYRLRKRGLGEGTSVAMLTSAEPTRVSNGLADFVYVTPEKDLAKQK